MKQIFTTDILVKKEEGKITVRQRFCVSCYNYKQYPKVEVDTNELLKFINSDEKTAIFTTETEIEI